LKNKSRSYFNAKVYKIAFSSKESKGGGFTAYEAAGKTHASSKQSKIDFLFAFLVYARLHETLVNEISILFWDS